MMGREIKFRVWDKIDHRMIYKSDIQKERCCLVIDLEGGIFDNKYGRFDEGKQNHNFYLMQFTGLLDKNGKEIWKGDIVRYISKQLDHPVDYEVVFKDGSFLQHHIAQRDRYNDPDVWIDWVELEVIGDIYSNPELLK